MLKDSELRAAQLETKIARLRNDNDNQEVLEERMESRLSESNPMISIDEAFIKGGVTSLDSRITILEGNLEKTEGRLEQERTERMEAERRLAQDY